MDIKIVKITKHKGRKIVIVQINESINEFKSFSDLYPYCNGYIELLNGENKTDYGKYYWLLSDEPTFIGKLTHLKIRDHKTYLGFDTAHYTNGLKPETKKMESVLNRCKKVVKELNTKRQVVKEIKKLKREIL